MTGRRSLSPLTALFAVLVTPTLAHAIEPSPDPEATATATPSPGGTATATAPAEPVEPGAVPEPGGVAAEPVGEPAPTDATATEPVVETTATTTTATTEVAPAEEPAPEPTVAVSAEPVPAPAEEVVEPVDPRDGAHLRPPNEAELTGKHPVDMETATYKPGTGLTINSKDGRFSLATRLRAQFLYTLEHDDEAQETAHGLQIRRARLQFKGHVFNEHNKFKTEFALSPRDMGYDGSTTHRTPILDWYFDFDYLRDLTLRIGQYKIPYSRQRVVSSGDLELVDRTIANGEFNLDRDVGIDLRSKDFLGLGKLRYYAGAYLGKGRDPYQATPENFDMMYLGRVEVLPFGDFKDYKEGDFDRSMRPRLSLGAAYAYVDSGIGNRGNRGSAPSDGGVTSTHNVNADAVFRIAGFSLFTEVYYRQGHRYFGNATEIDDMGNEVPAPRERARNGLGWSATASYFVPRIPFQIAARYGQVGPLDEAHSSLGRRDEVGGGVSYYFAGHPFKLQLDVFGRFDDGDASTAEEVVRLQLQASF